MAIFQRLRQAVVDLWQRTEPRDRNRFFVIAGVSLVMVFIAVGLLTQTKYVTLTDGTKSDGAIHAQVISALDTAGIKYKLSTNNSITVAEKDYTTAFSLLATSEIEKVPFDLSIYGLGTGLTSSSSTEKEYGKYQTSAFIKQMTEAMDNIQYAIVTLAIPDNKNSYIKEQVLDVKASVFVRTIDGNAPSATLANAIKKLAASSVPGLEVDNVTVTCQTGIVVGDMDDTLGLLQNRLDYQTKVRLQLENSLYALLLPVLGADNFSVAINVQLGWDVETIDSITFEPSVDDEGIVVSMQEISVISRNGGAVVGEPGMDENGGGDDYDEVTADNTSYYESMERTFNYAVTEIHRHIESEQGAITGITCSIVLNEEIFTDDNDTINNMKSIVGGALGLTAPDYARISVVFDEMRGIQDSLDVATQYNNEQRRQQILELIRVVVLYLVIGVCLVLLILKTYTLFKKTPTEDDLLVESLTEGFDPELDELQALVEMATLGEIAEAPKSPFREQIEKFIDKNPDAVADLLRNWLNDERY